MTYLLTGATGFAGRRLVDFLLARGDSVNYLGRQRSSELDSRAAFHSWNLNDQPRLESVPRVDAVINLMGEPIAQRWTPEVKQRIRASRIDGTRKLVAAIGELKYKPAVLVSASASGYYGNRGAEILTESSPPGSGFLAEVCVGWEREAVRAREFGLRVVTVRTATVLGREGGALAKMLPPFRWGLGGNFGSGKQWMSWIHLEDLLRLFAFAATETAIDGPLNGSTPNPVTNAEFTRSLARTLKRPAIVPIPKFGLKLALGEMANFLFDSIRAIPHGAEQRGFEFTYPLLTPALEKLLYENA